MNKELDDLISQADQQLVGVESAYLDKQAARHADAEVSREVSEQINLHADEAKRYPARHPMQVAFWLLCGLLLFAVQIYYFVMAPRATGPFHLVTGVVQSSFIIPTGRYYYGSAAASEVRLPDGKTITIGFNTVRLMPVGTQVTLRVYDTGAIRTDRVL